MKFPAKTVACSSYSMLAWLITTPFGFPVVPEVYSSVAGLSGVIIAMRLASGPGSAARCSAPAARKSAQLTNRRSPSGQAAASLTTTLARLGIAARAGPQRASWSAPSSTAILTSQSCAW
jgi:hypothetical protein